MVHVDHDLNEMENVFHHQNWKHIVVIDVNMKLYHYDIDCIG